MCMWGNVDRPLPGVRSFVSPLVTRVIPVKGDWSECHCFHSLTGFRLEPWIWLLVHNGRSMSIESRSLTWLCHVVAFHVVCWAVLHCDVSFLNLVGDKEIPLVDVPRSLAHTFAAIFFQLNGARVVLQYNCRLGWIALGFQEILRP